MNKTGIILTVIGFHLALSISSHNAKGWEGRIDVCGGQSKV